jgi:FixJ family two-component response regulator
MITESSLESRPGIASNPRRWPRALVEPALSEQLLIAVVDDDKSFRDSMRRLLRSLGYSVAAFPSASEFLASPKLVDTDCLVADVQMPAMTGIELCRYLAEIGRAIPTILVTAYPDEIFEEPVDRLGIECHLHKPLEEADLIDCLRTACARGKTPRKPQ